MKSILLPLALVVGLASTEVVTATPEIELQLTDASQDKAAVFSKGDPLTYIANQISLTKEEIGKGGRVVVQFVVTKSGKIEGIKFAKSYSKVVDAKVYKVIKEMGDWTPAIKDGVAVDSHHSLPITLQPE